MLPYLLSVLTYCWLLVDFEFEFEFEFELGTESADLEHGTDGLFARRSEYQRGVLGNQVTQQ